MVRPISKILLDFLPAQRGNVALTFGLSFLPLLIVIGFAIDYSRAVTQRSNLQQATDSTVLAIAHNYLTAASTCQTLYNPTQTYLTGTMNTVAAAQATATVNSACSGTSLTGSPGQAILQNITFQQNNTGMCIQTSMQLKTAMMTIVNIKTMYVNAMACSQVGGTYEVALVLDNSFSMNNSAGSQSKMQALQTAAVSLINTLIPDGTTAPNAAISIVPFNALVNVTATPATIPAFMDTAGTSSLNWKDINAPTWITNRKPTRFDLFSTLQRSDGTSVPWLGCVEERPNNVGSSLSDQTNYMTTDIAATTGDSLFVPYFAPDEPGSLNGASNSSYYGLSYETYYDGSTYCPSNGSCSFLNSYLADTGSTNPTSACTSADVTADKASKVYPGGGMTMACRYKGVKTNINPSTNNGTTQWFGLDASPNSNCTTPAITPLTTQKSTLTAAINAMVPTGLTNLGTGMMWGWRTISGIGTPFFPGASTNVTKATPIGPKVPVPYGYVGPPPNTKVMILMTDGENSWAPYINSDAQNYGLNSPFRSQYEAFGYMTDGRLSNYSTTCPISGTAMTGSGYKSDATLIGAYPAYRCQLDNMLLEACTNAKNAGITIYTVGFSTSTDQIDSEGLAVLKGCASSAATNYIAANGNDIVTKFQQIAAAITNLRISQ